MRRIARWMLCGAILWFFPPSALKAQEGTASYSQPASVMDAVADEMIRITSDASRNGFKAEHFRRYAALVRALDADLEENGTNREIDGKLDEDDAARLNPALAARITAEYWKKKGVRLDEQELRARLLMNAKSYLDTKAAIKRMGGVRALHKAIADALEEKAKEIEAAASRVDPVLHRDRFAYGARILGIRPEFTPAQYDLSYLVGVNVDCLCKAMVTEGVILTIFCVACPACQPACASAAFLLALEKLMEAYGICDPSRC